MLAPWSEGMVLHSSPACLSHCLTRRLFQPLVRASGGCVVCQGLKEEGASFLTSRVIRVPGVTGRPSGVQPWVAGWTSFGPLGAGTVPGHEAGLAERASTEHTPRPVSSAGTRAPQPRKAIHRPRLPPPVLPSRQCPGPQGKGQLCGQKDPGGRTHGHCSPRAKGRGR